ncbi:MAG: hypothetical protein GAK29_03716 [Acinetobacter bereziniae]|uniref:Uncharacterized protein n=1 Tax=Acinetobacter bereziniae TaxID=106648 RepID=A0A833PD46_ACIBZ|nr:MAG: hypothetical protein GAK29_03716 [Acinetobacter bereziniae]
MDIRPSLLSYLFVGSVKWQLNYQFPELILEVDDKQVRLNPEQILEIQIQKGWLWSSLKIITEYKISLDSFNTFTSYLFEHDNQEKLSLIFTRWFLSRKISLNYFASKLLGDHELEAQFDITQLTNQFSQDHFFLAKKHVVGAL